MKKFLKWTGIVFGVLLGLSILAGVALYPIGMSKLTQTYPNTVVETVNIPTDADAVERGGHIATIWVCTKCHGPDLSGTLMTTDPIEGAIPTYGAIPASNLTPGQGGVGLTYSDTDWVRAIRHRVKPDAQVEILMFNYSTMSDQDLGDLIAYLKQIPPVDSGLPEANYGPFIPVASAIGLITPMAETLNHNTPRLADSDPGVTVEYGRYLSAICAQCHGTGIARAVKNWKQEDFVRTFNTGVLPNGKQLGSTMSSPTFREMTDMELAALWLYFMDVKP